MNKVCPECGAEFYQKKGPKNERIYCSYWCHLAARRDGNLW